MFVLICPFFWTLCCVAFVLLQTRCLLQSIAPCLPVLTRFHLAGKELVCSERRVHTAPQRSVVPLQQRPCKLTLNLSEQSVFKYRSSWGRREGTNRAACAHKSKQLSIGMGVLQSPHRPTQNHLCLCAQLPAHHCPTEVPVPLVR